MDQRNKHPNHLSHAFITFPSCPVTASAGFSGSGRRRAKAVASSALFYGWSSANGEKTRKALAKSEKNVKQHEERGTYQLVWSCGKKAMKGTKKKQHCPQPKHIGQFLSNPLPPTELRYLGVDVEDRATHGRPGQTSDGARGQLTFVQTIRCKDLNSGREPPFGVLEGFFFCFLGLRWGICLFFALGDLYVFLFWYMCW